MDCKTAFELMMKYLDKDIKFEQEKLLIEHIDLCDDCRFEFVSLKETVSMLDDIEMEQPPSDLEKKVIERIIDDNAAECIKEGLIAGVVTFIVLLFGCFIFIYQAPYKPALDWIYKCFDIFLYVLDKLFGYMIRGCFLGIGLSAKIISLGRVFDKVLTDIANAYYVFIYILSISLLFFILMYGNMLKKIRR